MKHQVRVWVLLFNNLPRETGLLQEAYWVNGNKNELVICIGLNEDKIMWSHIFSWTESQTIKIELRNFIYPSKKTKINQKFLVICGFLKKYTNARA